MKEIEAKEAPEAIWDYSFRQFGVVQADEYFDRIASVFGVLTMHELGTQCAELGEDIFNST